ncbi:HypC/HybG/HupF family hydrogenase formation chaperone [Candidatus Heimdallarchaeota archaeon]|nr:MAG: HypC/HybG/HupF family hydrogenase formation chaperone [Candidatus Heimdallarchaeota archaeon]
MCLAIPAKVIKKIDGDTLLVDFGGVQREVKSTLLEEEPKVGEDYVLVHIGFAMTIIEQKEALETIKLLSEVDAAYQKELEQAN